MKFTFEFMNSEDHLYSSACRANPLRKGNTSLGSNTMCGDGNTSLGKQYHVWGWQHQLRQAIPCVGVATATLTSNDRYAATLTKKGIAVSLKSGQRHQWDIEYMEERVANTARWWPNTARWQPNTASWRGQTQPGDVAKHSNVTWPNTARWRGQTQLGDVAKHS